jgi:hypothetical protein
MQDQQETQPTTQAGLCENCLPDATVWATSTPDGNLGPKSYFLLIHDNGTQIAFELQYHAKDKKVVAVPYRPDDYSYTRHDACDHERGECIDDTEEAYEQIRIDEAAVKASYVEER